VTVERGRKGKQLLDYMKVRIEEAIDRTLRRTHFERGYGRVGRKYINV